MSLIGNIYRSSSVGTGKGGKGDGGYAVGGAGTSSSAAPKKKGGVDKEGESGPGNMRAGTRVFAKFRDGTERKAEVIERRPAKDEDEREIPGVFKYYVHYTDFNRRMDTWLKNDEVRYDAEGDAAAKLAAKAKEAREKARQAAESMGGKGTMMGGKSGGKTGAKVGAPGGGAAAAHRPAHGHGASLSGGADGTEIVDSDGTVLRMQK